MRRQLRHVLPELMHWFGLHPRDLDDLTYGELEEIHKRLAKLPPIGAVQVVSGERR